MRRLTDAVLRHRLLVALAWVAIAVAGGATAPTTVDRLSYEFALPGEAAYETNQQIIETYGGGGLTRPAAPLVVDGGDAPEQAVGLGVAIDYSLLVVTRWREETAKGVANDDAVRTAMATAGRAVVFSGVTVAVSLAALVLVPIPFLRSIGLGGLLIPLFSVAVSLTLVPALLSAAGPRLSWPRRKAAVTRSRLWAAITTGVLRRRWLVVLGSVVVLLALAAPVLGLTLGTPQLSGISSATPASVALTSAVDDGLPAGVVRPTEILVDPDDAPAVLEQLGGVDGVAAAVGPQGPGWAADGQALLQVWTDSDPSTDDGRATVERVRAVAADAGAVGVGGTPAEDADFISAVYGNAIWVVLGVAVVTFLLLARALRSLWLPVKALALNVLSLGAAYGITVLIWQDGYGSDLLFGQSASGVITIWVPVAAFAFLFGLSMDYEVFLLSRMREEYDPGHRTPPRSRRSTATDRAVVEGIANTGRLVTGGADPVLRLHRPLDGARGRGQGPRDHAGPGHRHRRRDRARPARPGAGRRARPGELDDALRAGAGAAPAGGGGGADAAVTARGCGTCARSPRPASESCA